MESAAGIKAAVPGGCALTWERYREPTQTGLELEVWTGRVFHPRFYCCDDITNPIQLYAEKPPVCHLSLTPRIAYIGEAIAWDIGNSYSPTDTVDVFYINWGGATDIGNLSAEDFLLDPTSGDVVYDTIGTYTVEAYVKDVLTVESQHVFITVEIVEPVERVYIGTTDGGVFISDNGSDPIASNTGLSGDQLKVRSLRVNPHYMDLETDNQHIWIATVDGLSYSTDGAATWLNISKATMGEPVNDAADDPAPASADLLQTDVWFDPADSQRLYLQRYTITPEKRVWLYNSGDYGVTWENSQVSV